MVIHTRMIALSIALAGCAVTPRTEVIVVVDTNLRGPGGIDTIFIDVTAPDGTTTQSAIARLGVGEALLPRTLGLLHERDRLGPYTVSARGNTGGALRVARTARFSFVPGRTLVLRMDLLASCEGHACSAGQTCGESGCRSIDVAPGELLEWNGAAPGLDASIPEARDAARPDGGGGDAATGDASPMDAGAIEDGGPVPDGGMVGDDAGPLVDGGTIDSGGGADAGGADAGPRDAGSVDAPMRDGGPDSCVAAIETCNARDDDCDSNVDEGFDTATDESNCGTCGHVCNMENATGECFFGECTVFACDPGFDDCNDDGDDGCEANLDTDPSHCDTCDRRCAPSRPMCCAGACRATCM
jgi:hypothetical protein